MKVTSIPVLACVALALAACSPAQNPASPTSLSPVTDTTVPATPTATLALPTNTPSGPVGSISGNIIPIGSPQPATSLKIFAREKNAGTIYTTDFSIDVTSYTISNLPPGVYNVFAWYYKGGLPGAYTSAKITFAGTSEDQFNCTNSLLDITISTSSLDFKGADIACWGGNFFSYLPQDLLP
ncbi:MAG: hypothetical protein ABSC61_07375 [Anaerolineales bacterium]